MNDGQATEKAQTLFDSFQLLIWVAAAIVAFLPFAFNTSAWDAVTFRVPGNQGNWWHFLVGLPCFLAFPAVWVRARVLYSQRTSRVERRFIWIIVGVSICGTLAVETPFLLHLAGTRGWPSFTLLFAGLGVLGTSGALLLVRRRYLSPTRACIGGLNTAYLANMGLCLIVYSTATGSLYSRIGWMITMALVWPIALDLALILRGKKPERGPEARSSALTAP